MLLLLALSLSMAATDCRSLSQTPVDTTFSDVTIGREVYPLTQGSRVLARNQWKTLREDLILCGASEPAKHLRRWIIYRKVSVYSLAFIGAPPYIVTPTGFVIAAAVNRAQFDSKLTRWDQDNDGVDPDACPDDSEDFDGWNDSDGCPDPDNDNDGVLDINDICQLDPEDYDGYRDSDGCPDDDNDKDGVIDEMDQCPDDPEVANNYLDDDGCSDERPVEDSHTPSGPDTHSGKSLDMILRDYGTTPEKVRRATPATTTAQCKNGQPCGGSCISWKYTCHK